MKSWTRGRLERLALWGFVIWVVWAGLAACLGPGEAALVLLGVVIVVGGLSAAIVFVAEKALGMRDDAIE